MVTDYVNLYEYFKKPAPENAKGILQVMLPHIPKNLHAGRTRPGVLVLPGGGYSYVSDREAEPVALHFLSQGYCAFVLDYSCAPHRFPVALQEAAMAMAYIRQNAAQFQIDPKMVAAIGFSAGGHLCGCLGTMYDCPEVTELKLPQPVRPDALGLCYPVAVSWGKTHTGSFRNLTGGDEPLWERFSLDKQVRPDMPPVFVWATRNDETVPVRNSLVLGCALDEAGVDFTLRIYRNGSHGLGSADITVYDKMPQISADIPNWTRDMMGFFREVGLQIRSGE